MKDRRTLATRAAISLLIIIVITLIAEVGLRLAGHVYLRKMYVQRSAFVDAAPNSIKIVALGESTTGGLWVSGLQSYPAQLERMLEEHHPGFEFLVIVPPHVGQNTSQTASRTATRRAGALRSS